jgi:hypothetical protein
VALALAVVALSVTLGAAEALAGTYSVTADCNSNHAWTPSAGSRGTMPAYTDCNGANIPGGMKMFVSPQNDDAHWNAKGDIASFTFRAPTGTRIFGVDWRATAYEGTTSFCWASSSCLQRPWRYTSGLLADNPIRSVGLYCGTENIGHCAVQSGPSSRGKSLGGYVPGLNEGALAFYVGCEKADCPAKSDGDPGHFYSRAWLSVSEARVDLIDNTNPDFIRGRGALWTNGDWLSGAGAIGFDAVDNTGIRRGRVVVDPGTHGEHVAVDVQFDCDYTYAVPCGSHDAGGSSENVDGRINTNDYADGSHRIQLEAMDASGNWRKTATAFNIDNHAPGEPLTPSVVGGEDWHTTNDFDIDWANPDGQASPIVRANYELCSGTGECTTGSQSARDISELTDIEVPQPGDYKLRVWLVDEAGNSTPTAKSRELRLKFDDVAPAKAEPQRTNGWVNARDAVGFVQRIAKPDRATVPVSGVKGYAISTDGSAPGNTADVGADPVDYSAQAELGNLPAGVTHFRARAISGAGIPSSELGTEDIHADLSSPALKAEGGPDPHRWSREPVAVTITADEGPGNSGMAGAEASNQTDEDGAYLSFSTNGGDQQTARGPSEPSDPATGRRPFVQSAATTIRLSADGAHIVRYSATDVAGNTAPEQSVAFKIDGTAPEVVVFERQRADDPRLVAVDAADATSGLADGGIIQLRRVRPTVGDWLTLRTSRVDHQYYARIDNSDLPEGDYEFRATVPDQAGNRATGATGRGGQPYVLHIDPTHVGPYPTSGDRARGGPEASDYGASITTRLTAGVVRTARRKCKTVKGPGGRKRKKCTRTAPTRAKPARSAVVRYGTRTVTKGRLTTRDGRALTGAEVTVLSKPTADGATYKAEAAVRTNQRGGFSYKTPAGPSRTIEFAYRGDATYMRSAAKVKLRVPAAATIAASRRSARNGDSVSFRGRLRGRPYPTKGKVLDLQAFYRGKWRTFATPRARRSGAWRYRYRFETTRGTVIYRFRVRVRASSDYPYARGFSRTIKVRVTGR